MGELKSGLSRDDLETLIEAVSNWEADGNQEFHVMRMVENAPLPPEDHDAYEFVTNIKDHFRQKKKEIKRAQEIRAEKSTFLKAKLMLIRKDIGIDQLFSQSEAVEDDIPVEAPKKVKKKVVPKTDAYGEFPAIGEGEEVASLEAAVFFMKDLGVWGHYQKFLATRKEDTAEKAKAAEAEE
jgi:hypothetical protein